VVSGNSSRARSSTWAQASRASCSGDATAIRIPQHLSTPVENTGRFVVAPRRVKARIAGGKGGPHVSTPSRGPTGRLRGLDTRSRVKAFVLGRRTPVYCPRSASRRLSAVRSTPFTSRRKRPPWPKANAPTNPTTAGGPADTGSASVCAPAPDARSSPRGDAKAAHVSPPEAGDPRALPRGAPGARPRQPSSRKAGGTVPCARLG
jgi:hypothetical protein